MKLNPAAGLLYCSTVSEKYMDLGDTDSQQEDSNVQMLHWQASGERIQPAVQVAVQNEDVLSGRGKQSFNHSGNKRFRDMVQSSIKTYNNCESTAERAIVVQSIIDNIYAIGGRFLRQDKVAEEERWIVLTMQQCRDKVGHAIRDASKNTDGKKKRPSISPAAPTNQSIRRMQGQNTGVALRDYQLSHQQLSQETQENIPGLHSVRTDTMSFLAQQRLRQGNQLIRELQLRDEQLMAQQQIFMTQQLRRQQQLQQQQQLQLQLSQQQGSQGNSVASMPWQNIPGGHVAGRNTSLPASRNYDALGLNNEITRIGRAASLNHIQNRSSAGPQFRRIPVSGVRAPSSSIMGGVDDSLIHDQLVASFGGAFARRRTPDELSQEELLYPDPLPNVDDSGVPFANNRMNNLGMEEDEEGDPLLRAIDSALGPLSSDDSPEGQQQRLDEQLLAYAQYQNNAGLSRIYPPNQQR